MPDVHVQDLMLMTGRQLLSRRGLALGVLDATVGRHECCILVVSDGVAPSCAADREGRGWKLHLAFS